ncbi:MAG: diaminopimelate epimerase [Sphingomonas sp.]|uniref:diaminopimelate epimerase n=1 Tax=Sphingomonas sp. TaxID=28214 RepID=UPI0025E45981|nr:diaminopimelate epimerase [Sphingomonas sp.]MBX3563099.1 diaminopimelate epimerase [Sphingomonas sp.]
MQRIAFTKCHGSGNDFPLIDARALDLSDTEWAVLARVFSDRTGPVGGDGILLLTEGDDEHAFGMRMFNSDGSEAETCLNGLRCVARAGFEALGIDAARVRLQTSSAEVARAEAIAPGVVSVRTSARASLGIAATGPLSGLPSTRDFTAVSMPNPHLIAFVEAVNEAELVALGAWCEAAPPLLPERANVSFVEMHGSDLFVRTYERGVGLTNACGSAMAAAVFAAGLTGRVAWGREVIVFNKGGLVRGSAASPADGAEVTITGNATFEWDGTIGADGSGLEVTRRRGDETAAWDAALAQISSNNAASPPIR